MIEGLLISKVQERVIQPKNHKPKINIKKAAKDAPVIIMEPFVLKIIPDRKNKLI